MIDIDVNGEAHRIVATTTLGQLLEMLELGGQALALAVNRSVVARQDWDRRQLTAGDRIDIVRAIGGG